MTSLRKGLLRIEGAADPVSGTLPILTGVPPTTGDGVGVDDEMRRNLAYGRPRSLLPYTRQWGYGRERAERELPTVVLENDLLTATFLPGYGGRLWSLVHRPSGRELLHRNPILQPANLALRDAWVAGGVEWNLGTTGHWPLTCEPLHAVRATAADGTPVLRMFEFERLRRLIVRIDAWLPAGSPVLYVHVSLHNPAHQVTPVYWWSNIAVPESAGSRVLCPADRAFHFDYVSDLRHVDFPGVDGADGADRSYPARAVRAADYFLDLPEGERRWIAALDEAGSGLVQTSTGRLRGRKLFCWGDTAGGRQWQEWLSGPGSPYLEIQAGLARTQLEHLPMPGGATWSWVEAYGRLDVDAAAAHGNWREACAATAEALERLVPPARLDEALGEAASFGPPEEWLAEGSGWGGLEGLDGFPPPGPAQEPWGHLLATGRLPVCDPPAPPITGRHWREALEGSADDWHAYYHLALMRLADGEDDAARDACELSVGARRTPWALRVLAFLAASPQEAADLLLEAHRLRPDLRELAVETLDAQLVAGRCEAALALIEELPYRDHGRIRLAEARAAHATGDDDRLRRLLAEGIRVDDLREGEVSLDRLWLAVHPGEPVPPRYDFRMSG
ncbi:DUF5107 domain-containing protein [Nonomuraea sp. NPDC047529]|uniref:DUF5107 domain-containing protein n=1 Tax=Nonomuraea sp. NPDC047529 TaxID=3155623 RepID=UPI00340F9CAF